MGRLLTVHTEMMGGVCTDCLPLIAELARPLTGSVNSLLGPTGLGLLLLCLSLFAEGLTVAGLELAERN